MEYHEMEYKKYHRMKCRYANALLSYKKLRNNKVHREDLQRGSTDSELYSQLREALITYSSGLTGRFSIRKMRETHLQKKLIFNVLSYFM